MHTRTASVFGNVLTIVALGALLLGPAAYADDDPAAAPAKPGVPDVQPFGGIRWDSSPADIIAKLNKLSPTTLVVGLNQYQFSSSFKGITEAGAINRELEALLRKPLVKPTDIARKGALAQFAVWKDNKGKEWHSSQQGMQMKATGVVIAGAVYDLSIQTMTSLGVVELTPQNVVWGKGEPSIALTIAISDMSLKAVSGSDDQKRAVLAALRKKYPTMADGYTNGTGLTGDDGTVLFTPSEIIYKRQRDSQRRYEKAAAVYKDKQNSAGKKDQSNSL